MRNILVVNVNWLGDAVFSTPVFKTLKDNYPQARVTCLCVPRVKKVLEFCPYIDEIITYDEDKRHFWPWDKWALISQLRQKSFDIAFILHRSMTRALLVYIAGIPQRVGYCKYKFLMTHPVEFQDEGIHRSDVYLKVLQSVGLEVKDKTCRLDLKSQDVKGLDDILELKGIKHEEKIIVLHTSGNWALKRWPPYNFVRLIKTISERFNGRIILSGGQKDADYCHKINHQADYKAIVLAGETTLGQSLVLYRKAQVVISSDSGPLHLAHSIGANVVGIYGPTRPETTGPRGKGNATILFKDVGCNKAPCYHLSCSNNHCMQAVATNDVLEVIQTILR